MGRGRSVQIQTFLHEAHYSVWTHRLGIVGAEIYIKYMYGIIATRILFRTYISHQSYRFAVCDGTISHCTHLVSRNRWWVILAHIGEFSTTTFLCEFRPPVACSHFDHTRHMISSVIFIQKKIANDSISNQSFSILICCIIQITISEPVLQTKFAKWRIERHLFG